MMPREPLAIDKLTEPSRAFAERVFHRCPDLIPRAYMEVREGAAGLDLVIDVSSPTGDGNRDVHVWMEKEQPSIGFGPWHTHADLWPGSDSVGSIVDLIDAILMDRFVLFADVDREEPSTYDVLDLRDPDALTEELTSKYSSGRIRIKSWSGKGDRTVGLGDL